MGKSLVFSKLPSLRKVDRPRDRSILFVNPDYHCTFFYRDQLVKYGWRADIYVAQSYPIELLYSTENLLKPPILGRGNGSLRKFVNQILLALWWLGTFWRYRFLFYYGRPPAVSLRESQWLPGKDRSSFVFELALAKFAGCKLIYLPSGCKEEETQSIFSLLDGGSVCDNCGARSACDDNQNELNFRRIRRYFDWVIGSGLVRSSQFDNPPFRWKSIDLNLWSPSLVIPDSHRLPGTENLRILHSEYLEKSGRTDGGKNIKGSPFVAEAVARLQSEGYNVEYLHISQAKSNEMRFYQSQADIVVEQLIYGSWGSTGVETTALGKPVVCYVRPHWRSNFLASFPEIGELPFVQANTTTIYKVLKSLIDEPDYRRRMGELSRSFAERHFDPIRNTKALIERLEML